MLLTLLFSIISLWIGSLACLYAYRVHLHPLSNFPGPKLAAASRWYEFYYDVVLLGQFTFHLQDLHKRYGPIIRIGPDEIHIDDPDFFDSLYMRSGRADRVATQLSRFGNGYSIFTTGPDALHRLRRNPLNPFFSKRSIQGFQHVLQDKVNQLLAQMAKYKDTGRAFNLRDAYSALAGDMIIEYCFGESYNQLGSVDFKDNLEPAMMAASRQGHLAVQFPAIPRYMQKLPDRVVLAIEPLYSTIFAMQRSLRERAVSQREVAKNWKGGRTNVFIDLVNSDLPPEEKTDIRLQDEAQTLVGAGVTTTAWLLSVATFHIVNNPPIFQRLREELEKSLPEPTTPLQWSALEQLPYLTACLKEGLRKSYGVPGRTPRMYPQPVQYKEWTVPAWTAIGMSPMDICDNAEIFPDPHIYRPERWLDQPKTKNGDPLDKYFVGFLKGNRSCLGINLAWAELYLALAGVMRNFEFELYETDETDVDIKHDFTIPSPRLDSKGIRVTVKSTLVPCAK